MNESNLRVNKPKCVFGARKVEYCGHVISDKGGFKKNRSELVVNFPTSINISDVRSFCGFVNYFGKFIKNLSTKLSPIYELLKQNEGNFNWTEKANNSFKNLKSEIVSDSVLMLYNPNLMLILTCDASDVGVGAVFSQRCEDGTERPIEFASRVLRKSERNYSVIHKEALAIIFALEKFYYYLKGNEFELDHKPLVAIFGERKGIPKMSANRLQRWAEILSGFKYKIRHVKSEHNVADFLSRRPVPESAKSSRKYSEVTYLNYIDANPHFMVDTKLIKEFTEKDVILEKVKQWVKSGTNVKTSDPKLRPYVQKLSELSVENGILLWGHRVVVPLQLNDKVLKSVHR